MGGVLVFLCFGAFSASAHAFNCTASVTGRNWSTAGGSPWTNCTGGGTGAPGPTDTVTINANITLTLDTNSTIAGLTFNANGASQNSSLTQSGTNSLTVNGTVTMTGGSSDTANSAVWNINAATATVSGDITLTESSTNVNRVVKIVITTGTLNANSTAGTSFQLTGGATAASHIVDMSTGAGTGTFNLKGGISTNGSAGASGFTFTMGTSGSNFKYVGTLAQTITFPGAGAYNNLVINNTTGATLNAAITTSNVTGNVTVGDGSTAAIFRNGGNAIAGTSGKIFEVKNSADFQMSGTSTYPTGFTTFTYGPSSTVDYLQTNGPTVTNASYGHLKLLPAGATDIVLPATLNAIAGDLTVGDGANSGGATADANDPDITAATLTVAANATFTTGSGTITLTGTGTPFIKTGMFTASTNNTFNYTGNGATSTAATYYNLGLNPSGGSANVMGSGAYTINNNLTVGDGTNAGATGVANSPTVNAVNLTIAAGATYTTGSGTITLTGIGTPFTKTGTFTASTNNTFNYTGDGATSTPATYYNLGLKPSSSFDHVLGNGTYTVNGTLTVGDGANAGATGVANSPTISAANLTIAAGATYTTGSGTITLTGTGTPFTKTGTLTVSSGNTFDYTGNGATSTAATYYNLGLKPSGGSANVMGSGTYTIDNNLTVGDGANAGATAAANDADLNVTGTTTIASGAALTPGTGAFNFTGDLTVNGTLGGSGDANTITAIGNVTGSGTIDLGASGGSLEQRVSGDKNFGSTSGSSNWTFKNLTFSNSTSGGGATPVTITTQGGGTGFIEAGWTITIGGAADAVGATTTLKAGNRTWWAKRTDTTTAACTDGGSTRPLTINTTGILTAETSTFDFECVSGTATVDAASYYNLGFGTVADSSSGATFSLAGDTIVPGTLTIGNTGSTNSDTLDASSYNLTLNGSTTIASKGALSAPGAGKLLTCSRDFTIAGGTFTHNNGTVKFTTNDIAFTPDSASFYDLDIATGSRAVTISGTGTVTHTLIISENMLIMGGTLNVTGNIDVTKVWDSGNPEGGTGTVVMNGTGSQSITSVAGGVGLPHVTVDKSSGTLTLASSVISLEGWTHTQGTVTVGTTTLRFTGTYDDTFGVGTLSYYNVEFAKGNRALTIVGTGTVTNDLTVSNNTVTNGGTLNVEGDVSVTDEHWVNGQEGGNATIVLNGTGSQSITSVAGGVALPHVTVDKTTGTLTLASSVISLEGWTHTQGTVTVGTTTLRFTGYNNDTFGVGTLTYYNVEFAKSNRAVTIVGTGTVTNDLIVSDNTSINTGTLNVHGNVSVTAEHWVNGAEGGNATIVLNGTGSQSITSVAGGVALPHVTVDKTSGTLTLSSSVISMEGWTHTQGTVTIGTTTLRFTGYNDDTFGIGTLTYYGVEFAKGSRAVTIVGTGTVTNDMTVSNYTQLRTGTLNVQGDVSVTVVDCPWCPDGGDATIVLNGTGAQSITSVAGGVTLPHVTVDKTSGTLTLDSSVISVEGWTHTQGTVTIGTSTLRLSGNYDDTFGIGTLTYYNVEFAKSNRAVTIVGTGTVTNDLIVSDNTSINTGTLNVHGNVSVTAVHCPWCPDGGGATIVLNGTGSQSMTAVSGGSPLPHVTVDKTSGTLTLASPVISMEGWTHTQGTVSIGTSTLRLAGWNDDTFGVGTLSYYNVEFAKSIKIVTIVGTGTVTNDLIVSDNTQINTGTLNVQGNVSVTAVHCGWCPDGGDGTIVLNGTGSQSITMVSNGAPLPNVTINKSSGTAYMMSDVTLLAYYGATLTITSGTLDQGTSYNLTVGNLTVGVSGVLKNYGTGDLAIGSYASGTGTVDNSGRMELDSHDYRGDVCRDNADDILLTSLISPTKISWQGSGTFVIGNVSVQDQGGTAPITAYNSTNVSGNGGNWAFTTCDIHMNGNMFMSMD